MQTEDTNWPKVSPLFVAITDIHAHTERLCNCPEPRQVHLVPWFSSAFNCKGSHCSPQWTWKTLCKSPRASNNTRPLYRQTSPHHLTGPIRWWSQGETSTSWNSPSRITPWRTWMEHVFASRTNTNLWSLTWNHICPPGKYLTPLSKSDHLATTSHHQFKPCGMFARPLQRDKLSTSWLKRVKWL